MTVAPPRLSELSTSFTRLLTAADVLALPDSLPTGDVKYELYDGRLEIMAPPGDLHGRRQSLIVHHLLSIAEIRLALGEVRGEVGVLLKRNPDTLLGPDAVFILNQSLPVKHSPEGYLETIPEIVVEVRSKNETLPEIRTKIDKYFVAGVKLVWLIDGDAGTIAAYQFDGNVTIFQRGQQLTSVLLPGFAVDVEKLLA